MDPEFGWGLAAVGVIVSAAAYFVGSWLTGEKARKLESELKSTRDELGHSVLEVEELRAKLRAAQDEHDAYRMDVMDHFSGTSDLLRDLTVQYRSVYQHLTKGASILCPEGFVGLTEGLPKPELAGPAPDLEALEDTEDEVASEENPPSEQAHTTSAAS